MGELRAKSAARELEHHRALGVERGRNHLTGPVVEVTGHARGRLRQGSGLTCLGREDRVSRVGVRARDEVRVK